MVRDEGVFQIMTGLIDLLMSGPVWMFVSPFVLIALVIRFFRWTNAQSRGTDLDDVAESIERRGWAVRERGLDVRTAYRSRFRR